MRKMAASMLAAIVLTIAAHASGLPGFSTERHALRAEAWAEEALATDFATGVGEPKDLLEAEVFYTLAARQGMSCPQCLHNIARRLTAAQMRFVQNILSRTPDASPIRLKFFSRTGEARSGKTQSDLIRPVSVTTGDD